MVLLSVHFCNSEQIASHLSNWNSDLFSHDVSCCAFPNHRQFSVCLASYHLQVCFGVFLLLCFFLFFFLASCRRYGRGVDNSWPMQQIFGRSSLFHLFVTKILSLNLRNCRLKALFFVRPTMESKELDTRSLLPLPKEGRYGKHAKHLLIVLSHSLSSDNENSIIQGMEK